MQPHEVAELYRLTVEDIRETAVFLMDPDGFITVWNKAAEEMKGYPAEDAIGSHLSLLYTDEDKARGWPTHNLAAAAERGYYSEESWRKRKDGSLFWAHIALTCLRDDDEKLLGFSKITLDLTRHKLLEQCVKEKEEIDLILRAAESGTWKWNVISNQVFVSRNFFELLGFSEHESIVKFDEWLKFIHPLDVRSVREKLLAAREYYPDSQLETVVRFCRHDHGYHWFYVRADWQRENQDAPMLLMGVCVDIHTLKIAEQERERLYHQLQEERTRFSHILEQLPTGVVLADTPSGKVTYQNRAAELMLGPGLQTIESYREYDKFGLMNVAGERVKAEDLPLTRTILNKETTRSEELVYRRPDGTQAHYAVTTASIFDSDGIPRMAVAVMHDVTNLKEAQLLAATEKERAQVTLAAITDSVITTDLDGTIASINPAAERLTGWAQAEALGRSINNVVSMGDETGNALPILDSIRRSLGERRVVQGVPHAILEDKDGEHHSIESAVAPITLDDGNQIGAVLVFHDVTESRRLVRRLGFEASHDALTGLVNRREFEVRLLRALERTRRPGYAGAALLYMDLDQFKIVNDTCGHSAGDELLKTLAQIYREHVRERDTLARLGGDEFALIVEHCTVADATAVAQKILDATRNFRYACKGRLFQLGVSIGLIPIDSGASSVEQTLRQADHACYIAKERGRNRIHIHQGDDADLAQRRSDMHWVTRLGEAFHSDRLQLYCQPIIPIGKVESGTHYEILLRLKSDNDDPILPGKFLPAAERYDMMPNVDRWVLKKSLEWLEHHPEQLLDLKMCSINLSRRTLADPTFHKYAAGLIDAMAIPAGKLCFEITESGAIANIQNTISFIDALAARGCRFSLDDFGTGMTSFSYLKQLPVDFIKIDGSFIQMMSTSEIDYEMVRFANDISHMMGRQTIAEYVTDQSILKKLKEIGVDFAQGFWVGEPRPLAA
ncbi:MAG: EAL domain-containing protein [Pseudomonadota bacterium]